MKTRIPDEMLPESIGARLRLIREVFGLSKSQMADMLGIERTYWSRFEGGKRPITNETAYIMTERFGVTFDYLFLGRISTLPMDLAEKLRAASR